MGHFVSGASEQLQVEATQSCPGPEAAGERREHSSLEAASAAA